MKLWGAIEAGGTKFICAVGTNPDNLQREVSIPTTTPEETLTQVIQFFQQQQKKIKPLEAIGIGSFGPVDLNRNSPTFGYFLHTPKPSWVNIDFVGTIKRSLDLPVGFDTDVNAAALG